MKELVLRRIADFSEQLDGREIVTVSVGPNDEALVLAVAPDDKDKPFARVGRGGLSAASQVKPYQGQVLEFWPDCTGNLTLNEVTEAFPNIQPLPDGEIIVVASRCSSDEKNAAVYGASGELKRQFTLGDGIEDIQVAPDGAIWVSYFDEGIYGNLQAPSTSGLVRFNKYGEVLWRYQPPGGFDYISDCYAMNVSRRFVWLCYYTDFPIIRIPLFEGHVKGWTNSYSGARALISDNHRVLLFGGYKDINRCVVQEFGDDKMVRAREIKLTLPDGELPKRVRAIGRDSTLHLFIGTVWYQFDLAEVDA